MHPHPATTPPAHAARQVGEALGGSWSLIYEGDNLVFSDSSRVAKLARHPDGRQRLQTGLNAAAICASAGVPVVEPLISELVETAVGPVSLWPYVAHRHVTAADLSYSDGYQLGLAIAAVARMPADQHLTWDPYARIPHRLEATDAPADVVAQVAITVAAAQQAVGLDGAQAQFAHGDMSVANALFTADGVLLIDLDSAGTRPFGWDLACLDFHVARDNANMAAFTGAMDAWGSTLPHVALDGMAIIKAVMATTFLLTLEPTAERLSVVIGRCARIDRWVAEFLA
jgi:Ser/Thr protein kinase RdoA (MazF antagonist)